MVETFKDFRTYKVAVAAGSEETFNVAGTYFAALSASAGFELGLDDMPPTLFQAGLTVAVAPGEQFSAVRIVNPSGAAISVEFNVGFGSFTDARLVVPSGLDLSKSTDLENINDVTIAHNATVTLAAASTTRRELIISNPATSAAAIRIGRAGGVGAGSGMRLEPGGSLVLDTSAGVDCFNGTGASVDVAVLGVID